MTQSAKIPHKNQNNKPSELNKKNWNAYFIAYFATWIILSGIVDYLFLGFGIFAAAVSAFFTQKYSTIKTFKITKAGVLYVPLLLLEIKGASLELMGLILHHNKPNPAIKSILFPNVNNQTDLIMHGNAITMTPGTVVVAASLQDKTMIIQTINRPFLDSIPNSKVDEIIIESSPKFKQNKG